MIVDNRQGFSGFGLTPVLEIPTPSSVQHRADLINTVVEGLKSDAAKATGTDVASQFNTFYGAWKTFYTDLTNSSTAWMWTSTSDELDQYEAQTNSWRDTLANAGVKVTGPSVSQMESLPIKTLVYGAVALGALFVAGKFMDFLPRGKR